MDGQFWRASVRQWSALSLLAISTLACTAAACPTAAPAATASSSPSFPPLQTEAVVDPCQLVTQQEVDAVAGTPLAAGQPAGNPVESCTWTGAPTGPLGQVEVFVGDGAKKFLDIDRDVLGHSFTSVAGLGDEAYAEDDAIFVRKGVIWVALRLTRLNDSRANDAPLKELASRIVTRLP
jgi:hypothetical protein